MFVSVPPTLPGLINSINPSIDVGRAFYVFDIAWLFGVRFLFCSSRFLANGVDKFFVASGVYWTASVLFPAMETVLEKPILELVDPVENDKSVGSGNGDGKNT